MRADAGKYSFDPLFDPKETQSDKIVRKWAGKFTDVPTPIQHRGHPNVGSWFGRLRAYFEQRMGLEDIKGATPIFQNIRQFLLDEFNKSTLTGMKENPIDVERKIEKLYHRF